MSILNLLHFNVLCIIKSVCAHIYVYRQNLILTPLCCSNLHVGGLLPALFLKYSLPSAPGHLLSCFSSFPPILRHWVPLVLFTVLFSPLEFEPGGDEFTHLTSLLSYGHAWLQMYPLLRPLPGRQNLISNDWTDTIRARDWGVNTGPFLLMAVCSTDCIF